MGTERTIEVYRDLARVGARWADQTRSLATEHGIAVVNLIGSPGSGKTSLLEASVQHMATNGRLAVLEGDIATTADARRMDALGIQTSQLLTDGGCHLSAQLVHTAFRDLDLAQLDLVVIENVGNLVCPASFDIGEDAKVAVLSVTEGEEKPLKYPRLFRDASAVVVSKSDLLPHLPYRLDRCLANIRSIGGPRTPVFVVSALSGEGIDRWLAWLQNTGVQGKHDAHTVASSPQ